jgi:hypothetical protein
LVCWCVGVLVLVCWCVGVLVCWCASVRVFGCTVVSERGVWSCRLHHEERTNTTETQFDPLLGRSTAGRITALFIRDFIAKWYVFIF